MEIRRCAIYLFLIIMSPVSLAELYHEGSWDQQHPSATRAHPLPQSQQHSPYVTNGDHPQRLRYFPECSYRHQPSLLLDITEALRAGRPSLQDACILNPSIALLPDQRLFLVSYRIYYREGVSKPCPQAGSVPAGYQPFPWATDWQARNAFGLAVLDLPLSADGTAVEGWVITKANFAAFSAGGWMDLRLFYDQQGDLRVMFSSWEAPPAFTKMHTAKVHLQRKGDGGYSLSVGDAVQLTWKGLSHDEKNWIPHNGTNHVTYPHFPDGLSPHSVFEFPDFNQDAAYVQDFAHVAHDRYYHKLQASHKPWARFSGGSAAIQMPGDPDTFLAVGHIAAKPDCFHGPLLPRGQWEGGNSSGSGSSCGIAGSERERKHRRALLATQQQEQAASERRQSMLRQLQADGWGDGQPQHCEGKEYLSYFYSFSARPPYRLKALSHAFVLHDAPTHRGVQFAAGLTVREGLLVMSWGKDDFQSWLTVWPLAAMREYLIPLAELDAQGYRFCALGRGLQQQVLLED